MALPNDYWRSFDTTVDDLPSALEAMRNIAAYQAATGTRFVWRGVRDSTWPLYSSLVRAYVHQHGAVPMEPQLRELERGVVAEAREWALDWHHAGGRLSGLELLAALQHYSVPTRMIDFTFNPLIALWFACDTTSGEAGRLFAIDMSDRTVGRELAARDGLWWWDDFGTGVTTPWAVQSWIWRPPPFEPRIVRQDGCFLMGGVPSTTPARNYKRDGTGSWQMMHAHEVRTCMCVPFQLINYEQAVVAARGEQLRGHPPQVRAFTLRVRNKQAIAADLARTFGYSYSSLFPDFGGLERYGHSFR